MVVNVVFADNVLSWEHLLCVENTIKGGQGWSLEKNHMQVRGVTKEEASPMTTETSLRQYH